LIAPILSFTGEEVWSTLTGKDDVSVFEHQWYSLPLIPESRNLLDEWASVRQVREMVSKRLEEKRVAGEIGSSLAAELDLHIPTSSPLYGLFKKFGDELRLVFITSRATLHASEDGSPIQILVTSSPHAKCERCWHYRDDVGSDAAHPTLCGRCLSNLFGSGEARRHA
jgi:isoleucyl-tRNA synthetase